MSPVSLRSAMSMRPAIVVSRFNGEITGRLLDAATTYLQENDVAIQAEDIVWVPGAFELPIAAQALLRTGEYDGVICLGCVIKGETAHFELINSAASVGIMQVSLATQTPVTFGVLTTYDEEQALARSAQDASNKGREAAAACLEMAELLRKLKSRRVSRS